MKPFSGLIIESGAEAGRSFSRSLLAFWPVAWITKSAGISVPFVSLTWNVLPSVGNPFDGITTRAPVMSLYSRDNWLDIVPAVKS